MEDLVVTLEWLIEANQKQTSQTGEDTNAADCDEEVEQLGNNVAEGDAAYESLLSISVKMIQIPINEK